MSVRIACVFPGQGSQSVGMLSTFSDVPMVRQTFEEASDVLCQDFWRIASSDPSNVIHQTIYTQPLLLISGVALYRYWLALSHQASDYMPSVAAGHSLGEYTALVASGAISFHVALRWVFERATAMQHAVPEKEGAMGVVVGLSHQEVIQYCMSLEQDGKVLQAVNFNSDQQVVISGHRDRVEQALQGVRSMGAKISKLLPVSVPSHCSLMQPACDALNFSNHEVQDFIYPVLRNTDAKPHEKENVVHHLMKQLVMPVLWTRIVQNMKSVHYVLEMGPGGVLSGLHRRITGASGVPFSMDTESSMHHALEKITRGDVS